MVFVTGGSEKTGAGTSMRRSGYDAATGAQVWAATYGAPTGYSSAVGIAVSRNGSKVFVTGTSLQPNGLPTYATVAYQS
jgi:hypothetical protein